MTSDAQLTANRANAKLSTGPNTAEGLAAIAHNNFRHGLASTFVVLPGEDHAAYDDLLLNLNLEFSPSTETEEILVTAMAQHHWLTQRALRLQQPLLAQAVAALDAPPETNGTASPVPDAKQLNLYIRYQSTHDRAYHKSLTQLLRLRAGRRRAEIGFESQKARNELDQAKLAALAARAEAEKAKQQEALRANQRKEELHRQKLRQAEANASYAEFEDEVKRTMEAPIPGYGRVDFERVYKAMRTAIEFAQLDERAEKRNQAA